VVSVADRGKSSSQNSERWSRFLPESSARRAAAAFEKVTKSSKQKRATKSKPKGRKVPSYVPTSPLSLATQTALSRRKKTLLRFGRFRILARVTRRRKDWSLQ